MSALDRHLFEIVLDPYLPGESGYQCNRCKIVYRGYGYHCTRCEINPDTAQGYDICPLCWVKSSAVVTVTQYGAKNAKPAESKAASKTATALARNLSIAAHNQTSLQLQQQARDAAAAEAAAKANPLPVITVTPVKPTKLDASPSLSPTATPTIAEDGGKTDAAAAPTSPTSGGDGRSSPAVTSESPAIKPMVAPSMSRPTSIDEHKDSKDGSASGATATATDSKTAAKDAAAAAIAAKTAKSSDIPALSPHVLVKKVEQEDLVMRRPINLSRVVLRSAGAVVLEDEFTKSDYLIAASIAIIHCLIPGLFRIAKFGANFAGEAAGERAITALHIITAFPAVFGGCLLMRWINSLYITRARKLKLVGDVTSAQDALKAGLDGYLELDTPNHLDAWLKLRRVALTPDPQHRQVIGFLAPMVLANLGLLATMIIRTIFLKKTFDDFNVLGFFDMVVLDCYLISIVLYVVKCNSLIDDHIKILEREKLNVAKLMSIADEKDKYHYELLNLLMEASVTKLKHVPESITILGVVVDANLVTSFAIAALGGIGTALSKIITG